MLPSLPDLRQDQGFPQAGRLTSGLPRVLGNVLLDDQSPYLIHQDFMNIGEAVERVQRNGPDCEVYFR